MRKKKVAFTDEQLSLFRETCWRANRIKNEAVRFHAVYKLVSYLDPHDRRWYQNDVALHRLNATCEEILLDEDSESKE